MAAYIEIIAKEIHAAGWSYGETSYIDFDLSKHMTAVDAHKEGRIRCIVRADDRQTAFMELRSMTQKADKGANE
jgi:hypothetical protein